MGLVLGFDSINRERADGTLIKIISQPIYRDAVINGKFLAAVVTISIMLLSIFLVTTGFGLAVVGLVPEMEEVWRLFIFLVISIFYVSFWIALSIFFSILFKSIVTSALASGALWIFLWLIIPVGANVVADAVAPIDIQDETRTEIVVRNYRVKETISLASPMVLYSEATAAIIDPMLKTTRSITLMGPMERLLSARFQNPLALGQSVVVVLPHLTALIAITLICFALSYVVFMLQEIRT
jgi:ABC-2 type transport system permease protein